MALASKYKGFVVYFKVYGHLNPTWQISEKMRVPQSFYLLTKKM